MAWINASVTDYKDCLDLVRQFTQKTFKAGALTTGSNTGEGTVYGQCATHNSVAETWTLTCTNAGGNGLAVFSVTGSVTGALPLPAVAGDPYSSDYCSFLLWATGADYIVGDSFSFSIGASSAEWIQDRWDTNYDGSGGYELIQHGIGAGSDEIYAGYNTKTNGTTYWNLLNTGLTGYVSANTMENQPAYFPYYDCMNATGFAVTVIFNSRHIKVIPTLGSPAAIQGGSYAGFILPHATPSQWNYPIFNGGSTDDVAQLAGDTYDYHTTYWNAGGNFHPYDPQSSGAIYTGEGWKEISFYSPRSYSGYQWFPHIDGYPLLYPMTIIDEDTKNVYGDLDGVYFPSQYVSGGGLVVNGDVFVGTPIGTSDAIATVCFIDVARSGAGNTIAMELIGD